MVYQWRCVGLPVGGLGSFPGRSVREEAGVSIGCMTSAHLQIEINQLAPASPFAPTLILILSLEQEAHGMEV